MKGKGWDGERGKDKAKSLKSENKEANRSDGKREGKSGEKEKT
jgi:hypothetical protein